MSDCSDQLFNDIFYRLADMERMGEVSSLHQLEREATILREQINTRTERISTTLSMLQEAEKIFKVVSVSAEAFDIKKRNAENKWARYWGVAEGFQEAIFEMESIVSRIT